MTRLFLDANILFSAAWRNDSPADLLFQLCKGDHGYELITSAFALEEASRNIQIKRPERRTALQELSTQISFSRIPNASAMAAASKHGLPEKDIPILAAAITAGAQGLVTGDRKHFGSLYGRHVNGVQVLTLAAALQRIVS
ncbi:MAG: PIN domain-containing protein [Sinobacteraceae bacterium]|nr:PIN domain-containing protein [Nevskiaceae bacterium]